MKLKAILWEKNDNEIGPLINEQTTLYCEMLSIRDPIRVLLERKGKGSIVSDSQTKMYNNLLDDGEDEDDYNESPTK